MSMEKGVLEVRGADVEQAVADGLAELGMGREQVDIEILDEGSGGFLGIGARDALVRLTPRAIIVPEEQEATGITAEGRIQGADSSEAEGAMVLSSEEVADEADEGSEEQAVALEIVGDLLEKMQVEAKVGVHLTDRDELSGQRRLVIDIRGDDLGVLIGPRGETLYAFQFVARLMAGHVLRHRPYFIIDVEGYRERREKALARLADRMAGKVVKSGRATTLEPMPANERRVIHMTLRENREVFTESTGEGNRRRVRIIPEGSR